MISLPKARVGKGMETRIGNFLTYFRKAAFFTRKSNETKQIAELLVKAVGEPVLESKVMSIALFPLCTIPDARY